MLHKTRVKLTLRALEQYNGIDGMKLMKLVGTDNSGTLKLILKDLEKNNYIFTSEDRKLFEEFYTGFDISDEIYVTEAGMKFLKDFEDNTRILLETISERSYNNTEKLLPYLTLNQYKEVLNSSIHDGYISTKSNDRVYLETKEVLILSSNIFVTSKGRDYLNNKIKESHSINTYTTNNYGNLAQSIGDNSPVTMHIHQNEAFNELNDLLDYLTNDLTKRESKSIEDIFEEVVKNPSEKKSILEKAENQLAKHPKLIATLQFALPLVINNWNKIQNFF